MLKSLHTKTKALLMAGLKAGLMAVLMLLTMLSTATATELHQAAKDGDNARITTLLDRGANIEARNKDGATPIHFAAYEGHTQAITALLDRSADPNSKDKWGKTALDLIDKDNPAYGTDAYWRLHDAKFNQ